MQQSSRFSLVASTWAMSAAEREKGFGRALSAAHARVSEHYAFIKEEQKARLRKWEDDKVNLEAMLASVLQTQVQCDERAHDHRERCNNSHRLRLLCDTCAPAHASYCHVHIAQIATTVARLPGRAQGV